jgi:hypothetical protein
MPRRSLPKIDVADGDYHHLSQAEKACGKRISRHLSTKLEITSQMTSLYNHAAKDRW